MLGGTAWLSRAPDGSRSVCTFLKEQMTWLGALTAARGPARHSENTFLSLPRAVRLGIAVAASGQDLAPPHRSPRASQVALVAKNPSANAGDKRDVGLIPRVGRSPGGGHGNPLQYSCLENPMDRGA